MNQTSDPGLQVEYWIAKARKMGIESVAGLEDFREKLGVPQAITSAYVERGHVSKPAKRAATRRMLEEIAQVEAAQSAAAAAYEQLLAAGTIRRLGRRERLEEVASGHPDNPSTQAARRLLAAWDQAIQDEAR